MNIFYTFLYYLELKDIAITRNVGFLPSDVKKIKNNLWLPFPLTPKQCLLMVFNVFCQSFPSFFNNVHIILKIQTPLKV